MPQRNNPAGQRILSPPQFGINLVELKSLLIYAECMHYCTESGLCYGQSVFGVTPFTYILTVCNYGLYYCTEP